MESIIFQVLGDALHEYQRKQEVLEGDYLKTAWYGFV